MNTADSNHHGNELDQAVSRRLGRLRSLPVETARLDRLIQEQIPRPQGQDRQRGLWLRPLRAVAAILVFAVLLGALIWSSSGGPAMASTAEMAQLHRDVVSGRVPVIQVDSIDQAGAALSGKWPEQPGLPEAPDSHVMACCMRSVKDRKVACVLFKNEGQPVTLSVAKASDLRSPQSPSLKRDGLQYHIESSDNLNMVSVQREGRWICLIGELPVDRLIDIAHGLRFQ